MGSSAPKGRSAWTSAPPRSTLASRGLRAKSKGPSGRPRRPIAAPRRSLGRAGGAGMMDCRAALNEAQGDMEAAVDWLRAKGLAKAAKKAGRVAAEGLIGLAAAAHQAALAAVHTETDL